MGLKKKTCGLELMPGNIEVSRFAVGLAKMPQSKSMYEWVESKVQKLEKNGDLERLRKKWLINPPHQPCLTDK